MIKLAGVSHVLLDLEGTTCPVSFVASSLFPYAAKHLGAYLNQHGEEQEVQLLVEGATRAWQQDADPEATSLRNNPQTSLNDYLQLLIRQDRKLTELKQLQGLIWESGYQSGELVAPLFTDVPGALQRWYQQGMVLAVYSSGSVAAQKLLYGHSNAGDLRHLFSHWFDTRTGPKQEQASYEAITKAMGVKPGHVLFISDAVVECEAADAVGMQFLFSDRPGNAATNVTTNAATSAATFAKISSFENLQLEP